MTIEIKSGTLEKRPNKVRIEKDRPTLSPQEFEARRKFWKYCNRAANAAKVRARLLNIPFDLNRGDIDELFMDQEWSCAISGVALEPPGGKHKPFHPSLDRIIPDRGYVRGNVRIVCLMVNYAMNKWGEGALRKLVKDMNLYLSMTTLDY